MLFGTGWCCRSYRWQGDCCYCYDCLFGSVAATAIGRAFAALQASVWHDCFEDVAVVVGSSVSGYTQTMVVVSCDCSGCKKDNDGSSGGITRHVFHS